VDLRNFVVRVGEKKGVCGVNIFVRYGWRERQDCFCKCRFVMLTNEKNGESRYIKICLLLKTKFWGTLLYGDNRVIGAHLKQLVLLVVRLEKIRGTAGESVAV